MVRRGKPWLLGELVQSAVDGVCVLTHAVSSEEIIQQVSAGPTRPPVLEPREYSDRKSVV